MPIRNLTPDDLEFALSLTTAEGWSYTRGELERMLRLDPEGSFLYEEDEPLAFITCVTYSGTGVVGHLVVSKEARGRKIGHSLVKRAIDYMSSRGADSVLLYATPEGVKLYEKHGFRRLREVSCVHATLQQKSHLMGSNPCTPVRKGDLEEIRSIDARLFGDDRRRLIQLLYEEFPEHSFKLEKNGEIVGYSFGRTTPTGFDLGPWACISGSRRDAEALFWKVISSFSEGTIFFGVFPENRAAVEITDALSKVRTWRTELMVRGAERYGSGIQQFFGLAAFELG